ncbi:MAG: hypothetical protein WBN68_00075 [Sedimenticolaceae bacterium]
MTRGVLVDAGPLDAIPHRDDNDHQFCVDALHKLGVKPTTLASRIKRRKIERPAQRIGSLNRLSCLPDIPTITPMPIRTENLNPDLPDIWDTAPPAMEFPDLYQ